MTTDSKELFDLLYAATEDWDLPLAENEIEAVVNTVLGWVYEKAFATEKANCDGCVQQSPHHTHRGYR